MATTNFYVFEMYKAHQGRQAVRTMTEASPIWITFPNGPLSIWGLVVSASLHGKKLVLTIVNPHVKEERSAEISLRAGSARSCAIQTFAASDIHAHNSFEDRHAVELQDTALTLRDKPVWTFKPASVTKLEFELE